MSAIARIRQDDLPLAHYRFKNRILLVAAPYASHSDYEQQHAMLDAHAEEMKQRDLIVVEVFDADNAAADLRRAYDLPEKGFAVALIGKDGTVKERQYTPMDMDFVFGLVDSMPMRKREREREAAE